MPEDTSKLLDLIEDLAIIAENAANTVGMLHVTIAPKTPIRENLIEVHLSHDIFDNLRKLYPGKTKTSDFSKDNLERSMIFYDEVKVFCLINKPKPELDINVVEPAHATAI